RKVSFAFTDSIITFPKNNKFSKFISWRLSLTFIINIINYLKNSFTSILVFITIKSSCFIFIFFQHFEVVFCIILHFLNYIRSRSEEHTSELQSRFDLVCRLLLEKKIYNIVNKYS